MWRLTCVVAVGFAWLAMGGIGYAEGEEGAAPHSLAEADTDQDGRISFDEFLAANEHKIRGKFDRADTNGDGFLSPDEVKSARSGGQGVTE